jgi:GTP cyclohydrolase II
MSAAHSPANSALFGNEGHLSVSRTLSELQGRRPVRINAPGEVLFTFPVEGLDDQRLCEFVALCSPNAPELIVTQQRARAIGIEASTPMASPLSREVASEASIPLASGTAARFVVFRDALGVDQVAIIIGKPNFAEPIPVRLHSACLTGDVFGSRRCDCGDQLQLALTRLESLGGGVVLYLAQEGRGIGLANKMRAYRLQDAGLDTRDANTMLGFKDDERDYGVATMMLRTLNCTRIVVLTTNPAKLDGLTKAGIEIADRVSLEAPINSHNERYLTTKAVRSGHKFVTLKASASEKS